MACQQLKKKFKISKKLMIKLFIITYYHYDFSCDDLHAFIFFYFFFLLLDIHLGLIPDCAEVLRG